MLRPASSSGVYSRMSGTFSTVSGMVNRGAISTMPPTLAAAMTASTNPMADRSSLRWKISGIALLSRHCRADDRLVLNYPRRVRKGADGEPDIDAADDRADQKKQPPECPRDVVWIHGDKGIDERVGQRAFLGIGPPHQTLNDTGVPHREDVDQGARNRQPEVDLDQHRRIH